MQWLLVVAYLHFALLFIAYFWHENCRCIDIFTPQEQKMLIKYRKENFAEKELVYRERRLIGKCPLTPEEVQNFCRYFVLYISDAVL
jgi:hypothetical protein